MNYMINNIMKIFNVPINYGWDLKLKMKMIKNISINKNYKIIIRCKWKNLNYFKIWLKSLIKKDINNYSNKKINLLNTDRRFINYCF